MVIVVDAMASAHNRREYVKFAGTLEDVEKRLRGKVHDTRYPRFRANGTDELPVWITHRVHAQLSSTIYKPSLSGDLGSTYGATHDSTQVAPCAMWEAGAGCCGTIGMPCQGFHDPELLMLNTCEMSKAVCQGFGCFRVVDNGFYHHDQWCSDVNYFTRERDAPRQGTVSDSTTSEDEEYAGDCWALALGKDLKQSARTPLDSTGYDQVVWFRNNLIKEKYESHFSAAGPGFAPMMYSILCYELEQGPDCTSFSHFLIFKGNRHEPIKHLDTPQDLREYTPGTDKFKYEYSNSSSSSGPLP